MSRKTRIVVKTVVWVLCLLPLAVLAQRAVTGDLTANPISFITNWRIWGVSLFIILYFFNPGFGQPLFNYQTKVLGLSQEKVKHLIERRRAATALRSPVVVSALCCSLDIAHAKSRNGND